MAFDRKEYQRQYYKEYHKQHYAENKEKIIEYNKRKYNKNKEKLIQYQREYYQKNKEILRIKNAEYRKKHKKERNALEKNKRDRNKTYKLRENIRVLIAKTIRDKGLTKSRKTEEILGCTIAEFIAYLQSKFQEGMTIENHRTMAHRPYNTCI